MARKRPRVGERAVASNSQSGCTHSARQPNHHHNRPPWPRFFERCQQSRCDTCPTCRATIRQSDAPTGNARVPTIPHRTSTCGAPGKLVSRRSCPGNAPQQLSSSRFTIGTQIARLYCIARKPCDTASLKECSHISDAMPLPRACSATMYPQLQTWLPGPGWFGLM